MVSVRAATPKDAEGILQIYAPHVLRGICTFETGVPTAEEMEARIAKCLQKFPWLVCEVNDMIAGYVYASTHREREAYQWTCESSVYVHNHFTGKGIGAKLYKALFQLLKMQGLVNVYAGITLPNETSIKLHENCGFQLFARYSNIGYKLGRWHDVGWWKLQLNEYDPKPSPPILFPALNKNGLSEVFEQAAAAIESKFKV
jgi:L-amino acid N-acyltransferase YncA